MTALDAGRALEPEQPVTRVLVIEDNPGDARLLEETLLEASRPYEFAFARTLEEAFALAETESFGLVLCDLGLPDSDGIQTFERCEARWPDSPVVVLTGVADERLAREAVESGAQDYLVKGDMNPRALARALHYSIERHANAQIRRRLEVELERTLRFQALGQLAGGVAHEINTPLQYISDNARFLESAVGDLTKVLEGVQRFVQAGKAAPPEELARLLEDADVEYLLEELPASVTQSADGLGKIARVVRAMRDFTHKGVQGKRSTDLNQAWETTVIVASSHWKPVAEVETDFDPDLPKVDCQSAEMNQVFLNLLVNAAQAIADVVAGTADRGKITIRTRGAGDRVEIRVEDTGSGISEEHRGKVFDPFFTTREVGQGSGQGLAISHRVVVQEHGGSIRCEPRPDGGTAFVVTLPCSLRASAVEAA